MWRSIIIITILLWFSTYLGYKILKHTLFQCEYWRQFYSYTLINAHNELKLFCAMNMKNELGILQIRTIYNFQTTHNIIWKVLLKHGTTLWNVPQRRQEVLLYWHAAADTNLVKGLLSSASAYSQCFLFNLIFAQEPTNREIKVFYDV